MKIYLPTIAFLVISITFIGCYGSSEKETSANIKNVGTVEKVIETPTVKGPIINLQDSLEVKQDVLCFKDSSSTLEGMYQKLSNIYNVKLQETIKANKLIVIGNPIAWQTILKDAYFFEAGLPVDKAPTKMGKGMYMKSTGEDSTLVAHFWGALSLKKSAYDALEERLTEMKKTKSSSVYEIYRGDFFPANNAAVDFYKLQTDIIMAYKKTIIKEKKAPSILLTSKEIKQQNKESKKKPKTKTK